MYTQTGDDRSEVEIQTIEISNVNKWTQFPISCGNHRNGDINLFAMVRTIIFLDKQIQL